MLQWLYMYVVSVCSKCFICFRQMLQVFYLDIAYVVVASVCSKCFSCFRYMLQVFKVLSVFSWMIQLESCGASTGRARVDSCMRARTEQTRAVPACTLETEQGRASGCKRSSGC
jgi:hypothetical protein